VKAGNLFANARASVRRECSLLIEGSSSRCQRDVRWNPDRSQPAQAATSTRCAGGAFQRPSWRDPASRNECSRSRAASRWRVRRELPSEWSARRVRNYRCPEHIRRQQQNDRSRSRRRRVSGAGGAWVHQSVSVTILRPRRIHSARAALSYRTSTGHQPGSVEIGRPRYRSVS